ncbi:phiSA1p31-related protein [Streptomyces sp. NPDC051561]|uniref:phiSA1p31-related protein n=1 Tax=Streptomyces sp. NPDC051561 TaxID=3365658 RepID=UPI0037AE52C1
MKIKFLDLDEHVLVITVDAQGALDITPTGGCTHAVASVLVHAARALVDAHPPYPCTPDAEQPSGDEPLHAEHGTLDAERRVWTDGTGHVWDLSVTWAAAATEPLWMWSGRLDHLGTPVMQPVGDDGVRESLDVLRALYGPISPVGGEQS